MLVVKKRDPKQVSRDITKTQAQAQAQAQTQSQAQWDNWARKVKGKSQEGSCTYQGQVNVKEEGWDQAASWIKESP